MLHDPQTEVRLRHNARARRITLRVSAADGGVTLTMPPGMPISAAQEFLHRQSDWLRERLAAAPVLRKPAIGQSMPYLGDMLSLLGHSKQRAAFAPGAVFIPNDNPGPALGRLLKARARVELGAASARYAAALGRAHGRITLRDPRGRWGSCTGRGDLMFSWRLIMAPQPVLDYVVAHEIAHLAQMNHSPAFWAVVQRLMPEYQTHRSWLRKHGAGLHIYDFS